MVGTEVKRRERAGARVRNSEEGGLPAQCLGPVRDARQSQRDRLLCVHQRPEDNGEAVLRKKAEPWREGASPSDPAPAAALNSVGPG